MNFINDQVALSSQTIYFTICYVNLLERVCPGAQFFILVELDFACKKS